MAQSHWLICEEGIFRSFSILLAKAWTNKFLESDLSFN